MSDDPRTRWRWWAAGVYLSTAALAATIIAVGFVLSINVPFFFFIGWSSTLAATVLLAGLMLTDFPLGEVEATPAVTLGYLASRLRYAQSRVEEGKDGLKVRLGTVGVAQIRAVRVGERSRVTFRADLSTSWWTVLILALFLVPFGVAAFPVIIWAFARARSFAVRSVAPLVPPGEVIPEPPGHDDVSALLVNGLAEGHRLAAEAYEAEHDSYLDTQGVVFLASLLIWTVALLFLFVGSTDPDVASRAAGAFGIAIPPAVAFGLGAGLLVHHRFTPRLRRYRARAEALRLAWTRETVRAPAEPSGSSAFELLAESSREVPEWLDAIRRQGLSSDPTSVLIVLVGFPWTIWFVVAAANLAATGNFLLAAVVGLLGIGLTVALVKLYQRWKRRWEDQLREELRAWTQRFDDLRGRIERYLQDL